jgi:hypothetical protein
MVKSGFGTKEKKKNIDSRDRNRKYGTWNMIEGRRKERNK